MIDADAEIIATSKYQKVSRWEINRHISYNSALHFAQNNIEL